MEEIFMYLKGTEQLVIFWEGIFSGLSQLRYVTREVRCMLPDRLAGCSGPACKSAQPMALFAKVGQKFSANQLAGIFRIRLYRTPIRLTYATVASLR
jgi:hypothetical protein